MEPTDSASLFKQSEAGTGRIEDVWVGISVLRREQTQACDRRRKRELASWFRIRHTRQVAQCFLDMLRCDPDSVRIFCKRRWIELARLKVRIRPANQPPTGNPSPHKHHAGDVPK